MQPGQHDIGKEAVRSFGEGGATVRETRRADVARERPTTTSGCRSEKCWLDDVRAVAGLSHVASAAAGGEGPRQVQLDLLRATSAVDRFFDLSVGADYPLASDGEDVAVVRAEALDARGRWVPTSNEKLVFRVRGAGRMIGVGNGDPNCHESDQAPSRSLFNGLAQLIVRAGRQAGDIVVEAAAESQVAGIKPARLVIVAKPSAGRPAVA
jgi:hypothetical protein